MGTIDLRKYLDEKGNALILHESKLEELGLTVRKAKVGELQGPRPM